MSAASADGTGSGESAGSSERVGAEILVEGRVQGVGFRQYARRCAEKLGIVGYAMNLPDGRVRVIAEGTKAAVDAIVRELERGPGRGARVTITWRAASGEFGGFGIRYHGHDA